MKYVLNISERNRKQTTKRQNEIESEKNNKKPIECS